MRKPNLVLSIFVSGLFPEDTAAEKEEIKDGLRANGSSGHSVFGSK